MSTVGRPNVFGNHIGMPEIRKTTALIAISQQDNFCPALKKSTYSGSVFSEFVTYSFMRRIQRRASEGHVIGPRQVKEAGGKKKTKPQPNPRRRRGRLWPP